jgi:hypothetical protein
MARLLIVLLLFSSSAFAQNGHAYPANPPGWKPVAHPQKCDSSHCYCPPEWRRIGDKCVYPIAGR